MVQFEYDKVMKRYNVKVPFTLAGESSKITIAAISENNRITLHREVSIKLLQQVLLSWAEHEHMETMRAEREAGEFDKYFDDKPKNDILTYLEERRQGSWKDIPIAIVREDKYLNFSTRTWNALISKGIHTVGELVEKKPSDLIKIKNFGRRSLTEVEIKLKEVGLTLRQTRKENNYGI